MFSEQNRFVYKEYSINERVSGLLVTCNEDFRDAKEQEP